MNTINNVDILKALLPEPSGSIYDLWQELKEKLAKDNVKVNYPTLRRHILKLRNDGLIEMEKGFRKNGKADERKPKKLFLSFRGLAFLILKADLSESECRAIVLKVFKEPQYEKVGIPNSMKEIPTIALKKTFEQIRPRINIEFFDEEYFENLLFETLVIDNLLNGIKEWEEKHFDKLSQKEQRQYAKKATKDAKRLPSEIPQMIFFVYYYLRKKRESWNEKILLLKPIIQCYLKMGFKPIEEKNQFGDKEREAILEAIQKSEEIPQEIKEYFQKNGG